MSRDAEPLPLEPGQRFAKKYRIERVLGQGGFGVVYLVSQEFEGRRWQHALKVLHPQKALALGESFVDEMEISHGLSHQHAVSIQEFGRWEDTLYFTMTYVEGETLEARILREGRIPLRPLLAWMEQLLDFLGYLHQQGMVHRDIKPANLLIEGSSAQLRVLDLGIARRMNDVAVPAQTYEVVGTPGYMDPVYLNSGIYDRQLDLYASGVTLYRAAVGPVADSFPPPRSSYPEDLPPTLAEVVERATAREREQRFADAAAFLAALRSLREDLDAPTRSEDPAEAETMTSPAPAAPARGPRWMLLLLLVALVGGSWFGWGLLRDASSVPDPPPEFAASAVTLIGEPEVIWEGDHFEVLVELSGGTPPYRFELGGDDATEEARRVGDGVEAGSSRYRVDAGSREGRAELRIVEGGGLVAKKDLRFTRPAPDTTPSSAEGDAEREGRGEAGDADAPEEGEAAEPGEGDDEGREVDQGSVPTPPAPRPLRATIRAPRQDAVVGCDVLLELELSGDAPFRVKIGDDEEEIVDQEQTFRRKLSLSHGPIEIPVKVLDRHDADSSELLRLECDGRAPELLSVLPARLLYTFDDDRARTFELSASEPLGPETGAEGLEVRVEGDRLTLSAPRGARDRRVVDLELVDRYGNRRKESVELVRARVPRGMEAIEGRTGASEFGLPWATPVREPRTGIVLVLIPPTSVWSEPFMVGGVQGDTVLEEAKYAALELPRFEAQLRRPFYVGETELSWAQWRKVPEAAVITPPSWWEESSMQDHPVVRVTWEEANAACEALGLRLPSEVEWEWVARLEHGAGGSLLPWAGELADGRHFVNLHDRSRREAGHPGGVVFDDGFVHTAPIGQLAPSPRLGLRHLFGNVAELTRDAFIEDAHGQWGAVAVTDPCREGAGQPSHVVRGCSFKEGADKCRISRRFRVDLGQRYDDVGIRVALDPLE